MKKRIFIALLALILCMLLCVSAFADRLYVIRDGAGLLTQEQADELDELSWQLCNEMDFQVVIVTVNSTGGQDIIEFADNMYDSSGYLPDGALLMLDMYNREWYVSTAGRGIEALSDYNIDLLMEDVLYYLAEGNYFDAFKSFILQCRDYVSDFDNGVYVPEEDDYYEYEYDWEDDYTYKKEGVSPGWIPGSLGIGLLISFLTTGKMKSEMNSVKPQTNANVYQKKGSLNLTEKQDTFLYHTVSRVPRPKDDDRSSHGGGNFGGGVHMSGGGVSHGGHGGHF